MLKDNIMVVVDEAVSNEMFKNFQAFLKRKEIKNTKSLFIAKEHPGMPDIHVVHHLLNRRTILFTCDRPLHNKVLSLGFKSFYAGVQSEHKSIFVSQKLSGIKIKKYPPLNKSDLKIKDNYHLPKTD